MPEETEGRKVNSWREGGGGVERQQRRVDNDGEKTKSRRGSLLPRKEDKQRIWKCGNEEECKKYKISKTRLEKRTINKKWWKQEKEYRNKK